MRDRAVLRRVVGFLSSLFRLRYRYECPAGHFSCSSNNQGVLVQMRADHQKNCEASRG